MNAFLRYGLLLIFIAGCEKDPAIDIDSANSNLLSSAIEREPMKWSETQFMAIVGNHPSFEDATQRLPIHVLGFVPNEAYDIKLYENDTLRFPDSLSYFKLIDLEAERLQDDYLVRLSRKSSKRDRLMRMTYRLGDSLYMSRVAELRASSLKTATVASFEVRRNSEDFVEIQWDDVPGADHYLLIFHDRTGRAFTAVTTYSEVIKFLDLRYGGEVVRSTTLDPGLIPGERYILDVYALTARRWMLGYGQHIFTAP